ncbi:MAG: exonuclease SbcCD subunit D C-terminal domain-containing protein [Bacteroidota bacterium]|nr:exonuclease SbcCD subunit D C-terminal domain-containing protein [Bacteroidota bacterium]
MSLKILHTADWHLGQIFHEYDRSFEHETFLKWLINTVCEYDADVLLMSGDVFDVSNPSAASTRLYYWFLRELTSAVPNIQIIITAGNHDSAARLEAPRLLLEAFNISIVGLVHKNEDTSINYEHLIIPLKNKAGQRKAWCMAIPFLKQGDYPVIEGATQPYAQGVTQFYQDAFAAALNKKLPGEAIVAMGHLHTLDAVSSEDDKSERAIMGGVEFIPASAFHEQIAYTALGHIHKAQKIAKKDHIRYSGSPIPMSFSEINYRHQVIFVELEGETAYKIEPIEIPVSIELLRVPAKPKPLNETLIELNQLPEVTDKTYAPFLEVRVLLDGPEPSLRHQIENAIENKQVRLTRINPVYKDAAPDENDAVKRQNDLTQLKPFDILSRVYEKKYNNKIPDELVKLFHEVSQKLETSDQ